jgi:Cu/Ag efflux protein CusF
MTRFDAMKQFSQIVLALALVAPMYAQSAENTVAPMDRMLIAATDAPPSEGEIRKVDPDAKKITIKHNELKNLDMPAMTMVFQVRDPAMLEQVKPGDKVKFRADKVNGAFTVMEMEVVK